MGYKEAVNALRDWELQQLERMMGQPELPVFLRPRRVHLQVGMACTCVEFFVTGKCSHLSKT